MCRQCLQALASSNIPNSHRLVERARHDEITLRIEVAAEDVVAVSFKRFQTFSATQLPYFERFIVAGCDEQSTIAAPCDIAYAQLVAGNCFLKFAIVRSPDLDKFVGS